MNETEVGALRQKLASRVRSDDYRQRRKDMDARVQIPTKSPADSEMMSPGDTR